MAKKNRHEIVDELDSFISRYVVCGDNERKLYEMWLLHTWQFEGFRPNTTPYLYVYSAQKGSGKTLLGQDIAEVLARNPIGVTGITTSTLFRMVESLNPTLMIDEVDTIWSGAKNEELRGVINSGYRRGGKVPRTEGKEVKLFSTFCPKVLIGIDNNMLPDTIRDRCIPIHMQRATEDERKGIQPFYHYEIEDEVEELQGKLSDWAMENGPRIREYKPEPIDNLSPRQWEVSMPLLQVAHIVGCELEVRKALIQVFSEVEEQRTPEQDMLAMIEELVQGDESYPNLTTNEILDYLSNDPRFEGWNGKQLGVKLAGFKVKPITVRRGNWTGRGYKKSDFADVFARYL